MVTKLKGITTQEAIDCIVANCGGRRVRKLLTEGPPKFTSKVIRSLAGTSPEYQRHVVDLAQAGDPSPLSMRASTLLVYDTVRFGEVTSRLHRAVGMVRKEAAFLTRAVGRGIEPNRLADRLLTVDLVAEQAARLRELLSGLETVAPAKRRATQSRKSDASLTDKLHAAGGLGLIAKNVRNVAKLRPEHRPTADQKEVALRLTADAHVLAVAARDVARRAFGRADDGCRVRPRPAPVRRVITHARPDGDAVAAAWLAERFLFAGEPVEVLFLPRNRAYGAWRAGDCLVDVGNTNDPTHFFFDHKPPAFRDRHDSCAARLVWDRLIALGRPVEHLKPLVDVVFAGDSKRERGRFQEEYAASKREGFHKFLSEAKAAEETDAGVYHRMRKWLDKGNTR